MKIEALNGAKYASGCAALGIVLSVHEDQVLLSLPGGLLGTIQYHEVSDVIHKLVQDREAGLTKQVSEIYSVYIVIS